MFCRHVGWARCSFTAMGRSTATAPLITCDSSAAHSGSGSTQIKGVALGCFGCLTGASGQFRGRLFSDRACLLVPASGLGERACLSPAPVDCPTTLQSLPRRDDENATCCDGRYVLLALEDQPYHGAGTAASHPLTAFQKTRDEALGIAMRAPLFALIVLALNRWRLRRVSLTAAYHLAVRECRNGRRRAAPKPQNPRTTSRARESCLCAARPGYSLP